MFNQRSRSGHVLVAGAIAGCTCLCAGVVQSLAQQPAAPPYKIVVDPASATIYTGDKPVLRYRYAEVPFKPYVDLFYTPSGVNILRDAVPDHKHHHGLMFALAVDGVNFWEETPGCGTQVHQVLTEVRTGKGGDIRYGGFVDGELAWVDPRTKTPVLFEDRRIELVQMKDQKASLLTWDSVLSLPEGKKTATLGGNEYYGLGMRFLPSMDKGGKSFNADGKAGVQATNAIRSRWCAYSAAVEGKPVTVAVFDHPANPRQPATWFTMEDPFAYLAATLNLKKEPLTLKEDRPMLLRYGVALWDGTAGAQEIDGLYGRWVELFKEPQGPGGSTQPGRQTSPPPPGAGGQPRPGGQSMPPPQPRPAK
jgi:hypothetical protein